MRGSLMADPTPKYPYLIEIQIDKKGRWSGNISIRKDMSIEYALKTLEESKSRSPQHNFRLIHRVIVE
jgi:hypothetical protein